MAKRNYTYSLQGEMSRCKTNDTVTCFPYDDILLEFFLMIFKHRCVEACSSGSVLCGIFVMLDLPHSTAVVAMTINKKTKRKKGGSQYCELRSRAWLILNNFNIRDDSVCLCFSQLT